MPAGEVQGPGQRRTALVGTAAGARGDLDARVALPARGGEVGEQLRDRLGPLPGQQVLVLRGAVAVGEVQVLQAVAHALRHLEAAGPGRGGVGDVEDGGR